MTDFNQPSFFRIGQDSEFFLWDPIKKEVLPSWKYFPKREDAKKLSADKMLPTLSSTYAKDFTYKPLKGKYNQRSLKYTDCKTPRVFRDGLAVEINTEPQTCRAFMWNGVRYGLYLSENWRQSKHITYTARPWVEVSQKLMDSFPEDLKQLGCSPSLDAYKEKVKTVGVDPLKTYYRTCGSHLHMSFHSPLAPEHWGPFIKLADVLLGVPHTYIFADELEFKRRKLYGQAGEFRKQDYPNGRMGLEYRVLSSRLWNHPGIFSLFSGFWKFFLGDTTTRQELLKAYDPAWADTIQGAINHGEKLDEALQISVKLIEKAVGNNCWGPFYPVKARFSALFPLLREKNLAGMLPDAGIYRYPQFGDGHRGFNEWSNMGWNLPVGVAPDAPQL